MLPGARRRRQYVFLHGYRLVRLLNKGEKTVPVSVSPPEELWSRQQPGCELPAPDNTSQCDPKHTAVLNKGESPSLPAEFDESGTELHKDARVWKAYVREADNHDIELVSGWNESTEVILIFAALFSAISTAFLIESTKLLQPDPAEASAHSMLVISRSLSAIANGTHSLGFTFPSSGNPTEFTPSRTAIWVNALWYSSLGLSLAASFIAILSKDWCQSFMSGRTGYHYEQMCRRQQKWDMIKEWKMSELLMILPSLIHLALFLFLVGLCMYLYDIHAAVATPIFCTTGAAIGFYVWSSIAAVKINHFPYPTIISRVYQAGVARRASRAILILVSQISPNPVIHNLYQFVMALVFVCIWLFKQPILLLIYLLTGLLSRRNIGLLTPLHWMPPLKLMQEVLFNLSAPHLDSLRAHTKALLGWLKNLRGYLESAEKQIKSDLDAFIWESQLNQQSAAQTDNNENKQSDVAILALSWMITHCEAPESVDIALQSIAGVTARNSRQPLVDCRATWEILRRLASSNLYKGSNARTDMKISLYTRALAQLGNAASLPLEAGQHWSVGELEGLIWDVHLKSEEKVAESVVSGSFYPTPANLEALRIGNTAASNTLKLLGRDSQKTNGGIDGVLHSIITRLQSHVDQSGPLHDAALLSLVNAAALLVPFAPSLPKATKLRSLCVRLIKPPSETLTRSDLLVSIIGVCACTFSDSTGSEKPESPKIRSLLLAVVRRLVLCYTETATLGMRSMFTLEMLATDSRAFNLLRFDMGFRDAMLDLAGSSLYELYGSFAKYQEGIRVKNSEGDMLESLRATRSPLNLGPAPILLPHTFIPFLILGPISCLGSPIGSSAHNEWAELASGSCFPTLSPTLTRLVERSDFISHLERVIKEGKHFEQFVALGQLWLLFTAYLDTSSDAPDERAQLGKQLQKYDVDHPESGQNRHAQTGDRLVSIWGSDIGRRKSQPLGVWPVRLMECVYESRNSTPPQAVCDGLRNVPDDRRHLSSITSWRPRSTEADTGDIPRPINDTYATNAGNDSAQYLPAPEIRGATVPGETDETSVVGCLLPGEGRGAVYEGIGRENVAQGTQGPSAEPREVKSGADVGSHVTVNMHVPESVSK